MHRLSKNGKQTRLTAAERKRKSRQNKMGKMTSEELQQYKAKGNTRRSELRIKQREKIVTRRFVQLSKK